MPPWTRLPGCETGDHYCTPSTPPTSTEAGDVPAVPGTLCGLDRDRRTTGRPRGVNSRSSAPRRATASMAPRSPTAADQEPTQEGPTRNPREGDEATQEVARRRRG